MDSTNQTLLEGSGRKRLRGLFPRAARSLEGDAETGAMSQESWDEMVVQQRLVEEAAIRLIHEVNVLYKFAPGSSSSQACKRPADELERRILMR